MSTASSPIQAVAPDRTLLGESRVVLRGISWDDYETILQIVGDRPLRLAYVDGDLEIMSPSMPHEVYSHLAGLLIHQVVLAFRIPCKGAGSTTFKKKLAQVGIEPDACFYFEQAKRLRLKSFEAGVGPYPDLAIEVDISHSSLDKLKIYAALGVPELWHADRQGLRFLQLQADGSYVEVDRSVSLPMLTSTEVWEWVVQGEQADDETSWMLQLLDWIRDVLVPRHRPEGERPG